MFPNHNMQLIVNVCVCVCACACVNMKLKKVGYVLFNDALNTLYLRLYGV